MSIIFLAIPKSDNFKSPNSVIKMLLGFKSQYMTPQECKYYNP